MSNKLLVTGMVRSGTTLISRALDAHPNVVCAPDPCLGVFRAIRNELMHLHFGGCPDPDAPFTDLFFDDQSWLHILLEANFDLPIKFESFEMIRNRLHDFNLGSNARRLVPLLYKLGGEKSYSELMKSLLDLLCEAYGTDTVQTVGFKQTWVEAFIPLFFNTWSDMVCVHVIRDPRALIASWLRTENLRHDYPLLMILRHWRKSAALANLFKRRLNGRYHIIRYEDFVNGPEGILRVLLGDLALPFDDRMIDASEFRSGVGKKWQANTSYSDGVDGISSSFVDRWRERLSENDIQFIEEMCAPEMEIWGYSRVTKRAGSELLFKSPQLFRQGSREKEWMARYADTYTLHPLNQARELYRWHLWTHPELASLLSDEDRIKVFIDPNLIGYDVPKN